MKIYLAWQKWSNGDGKHLRRYDPDNIEVFYGFEPQNEAALEWMKKAHNPEWPSCTIHTGLFDKKTTEPFEVIDEKLP